MTAPLETCFVAGQDGRSPSWVPVLPTQLSLAMPPSKGRHWQWLWPLTRQGTLFWAQATDHKPLLKIFGDRSLDQIGNTRLRNLKEKTLPYRFRIIHIPGVKNQTPDMLAVEYPTGTPTPERLVLQDDVHAVLDQAPTAGHSPPLPYSLASFDDSEDMVTILQDSLVLALTSTHPISWEQVQTATAENADMLLLTHTIETGFPDQRSSLADRQWSEHTKSLPPLQPGTHVYLQNQTGNRPKHWDKTGVVAESLPYHQYRVRMDGSGRATLKVSQDLQPHDPDSSSTYDTR